MRILFVGLRIDVPDEGTGVHHGVGARNMGLAWGLAKRGHDVTMTTVHGGGLTKRPHVNRVTVDEATPAEHDAVLLVDVPAIRDTLECFPAFEEKVRAHPCVVYQVDQPYTHIIDYAHIYAMLTPDAAYKVRQKVPAMADVFVLPWANASCPAHLPDPYPSFAGPRLIYAGGCEGWRPDHRRDVLNELASRTRGNYQVWFCGAVAYQGHTGPTEEERARDFHAAVRFVTDALPLAERVVDRTRDPPHILQGLVPYGPHWPWLQHATAGLGPAPWPGDEWPRCKIHDYLGCGVPVIVEYDRGPPNAGDILTLQAGEVVPFGDIDAIIDAMWRIWERKPDHEVIRAKAQIYTSWDENARLLESHIEDRLAQVPT